MTVWHTASMAWLVCDARVLASAEVADTRRARRRGLLGRDGLDGALVIERCRWIHTIGMKLPIDVAYLDPDAVVVTTIQMQRFRVGIPVWNASSVVEAEEDLHAAQEALAEPSVRRATQLAKTPTAPAPRAKTAASVRSCRTSRHCCNGCSALCTPGSSG